MSAADDLLDELAVLADSVGPALAAGGHSEALTGLTDAAVRMFGAAACSLAVLDDDDEEELVYAAASGAGADVVAGMRLPAGSGLAGWVVQSGQPIAVSDLAHDQRFDRTTAQATGYLPDSMIVVPVATDRRTYGVLSLLDRDATRPDAEHDMTLLSVLAQQAAVVLESLTAGARLGQVLLAALAGAARAGTPLATALEQAAGRDRGRGADLSAVAAAFAALTGAGAAERRLALGMLQQAADYVGRRSSRTA